MNDWDRNNLNYILSLDEDEFETWLVYLSESSFLIRAIPSLISSSLVA